MIIIWDVITRLPWVGPFYSDVSFFTRELAAVSNHPAAWSLFSISGSQEYAIALFVITIVAALSLLVGFRSQLSAIICLVLVYSINVRMPLTTDGGHVLLRMLLFWSVFLPMGARWSLDATIAGNRVGKVESIANFSTAVIMVQFACMYFFAGIAKCNEDWWYGDAIHRSLSLEMYAWPFAQFVKDLPQVWLLNAGRLLVVAEIVLPLFMFVPKIYRVARPVAAITFCAMHVGIWLTLSIGVFAAISIISWVLFVPLPNRLKRNTQSQHQAPVRPTSYGKRKTLIATQLFCGFGIVYIIALNVINLDIKRASLFLPDALQSIAWVTMTAQEFQMFSRPPKFSPVLSILVEDPTHAGAPLEYRNVVRSGEERVRPFPHPQNHLTRRLEYNLVHFYEIAPEQVATLRNAWGAYLCDRVKSANAGYNQDANWKCSVVCQLKNISGDASEDYQELWYGR